MSTPTKLISYEDSLMMPENRLEEIVHGESRIMPPSSEFHANLIECLFSLFLRQLDPRVYRNHIAGVGLGIQRKPLTYRVPDLAVYRKESLDRSRRMSGGRIRTCGPFPS